MLPLIILRGSRLSLIVVLVQCLKSLRVTRLKNREGITFVIPLLGILVLVLVQECVKVEPKLQLI